MSIQPRGPLLNPNLTRPDWQATISRANDALWLDKNENLDSKLLEVSQNILKDLAPVSLASYPNCGELYRKIAKWLNVTPDSLILTPGSDGAIRLTFEAFVNEGNAVVHTLPTFAMYSVYSQMFGVNAQPVVYKRGLKGPELSVDDILSHLTKIKPKLFCLPNPDSPTGTVLPSEALKKIVIHCLDINTLVLIDEAYHPFYDVTCVPWIREYRNLIVARTFSKAWGLAGLRIGYAVGHPDTIKFLHKLRPMYEVSTISIAFMERMLDFKDEMYRSVRRLNDGKAYFSKQMQNLGFGVLPSEGNFLHIAFGEYANIVHQSLKDKVLYRADFKEPCLKGYSRFSTTSIDTFEPIVKIIQKSITGDQV